MQSASRREPIAIVGMGGVFPGGESLEDFWSLVREGRSAAREPEGRWPLPPAAYKASREGEVDTILSTRCCPLDTVPDLPPGLDLDERLLGRMDPLFRIVLAAGARAAASARLDRVDRARVAVIVANIVLPTDAASELSRVVLEEASSGRVVAGQGAHPLDRAAAGLPAGLLARALGFGGGATTLDAACASSLYALSLACHDLWEGRADAVLTGGASRPSNLYTQMGFSALRALSRAGVCRPFDARGDGLVVGEGAGCFVVKRLADALSHGDTIHGLVHAVGLSNDMGGSLLAPDQEGQLRAMRSAYAEAGWEPRSVDLIECHGTGTPVGDAVEFASMRTLWGDEGTERPCVVGSVKSNVGHLLTGAGAAGLAKVLLSLRHRILPPTANFETPNPRLGYDEAPLRVLTKAEPWERRSDGTARRAAVSAFGFGGINGHVLVEEWCPEELPAQARLADGLRSRPTSVVVAGESEPPAIAVVGLAAHVGQLQDLRRFQEATLAGRPAFRPRPDDRFGAMEKTDWFVREGLGALPRDGAWLDELSVPIGKWRISPMELKEMSAQQILMLRVVDAALEDARSERSLGPRAGVFCGIGQDVEATSFATRWALPREVAAWAAEAGLDAAATEAWLGALRDAATPPLTAGRVTGNLGGIVASRVAREFVVGGPSFTVSDEENSGLRALEMAVRMLTAGALDLAVVGAVDVGGDPRSLWATGRLKPWSPTGQARPFDADAAGAVPGEGAAAVILKRLKDAQAAGDRIYAVVRGVGLASGGAPSDLAPSEDAYRRALARAYDEARVHPGDVEFLEAHGSGDPREDSAEARALVSFFSERRHGATAPDALPCALGAVKSVVGHTGCAAGLVSFVRAALCLYQEILPPLPGFERPRRELAGAAAAFHVPRSAQFWLRDRVRGPRRAGVSSMSVTGTCVHVVLEASEAPASGAAAVRAVTERRQPLGALAEGLFVVDGDDAPSVAAGLDELARTSVATDGSVEALARRWFHDHRPDQSHRFACALTARDPRDAAETASRAARALRERPEEAPPAAPPAQDRLFWSPRPLGAEADVAVLFPGAGNAFLGMGVEVGAAWPELLRGLDDETERLRAVMAPHRSVPWRLSWDRGWEADAEAGLLADHNTLIFSHVAHCMVMYDALWRFGVRPRAVVGYSLGETASYFATRTWAGRDEMLERLRASSLFVTDLIGPCRAARGAWNLGPGDPEVDWAVAVLDRPAAAVRGALEGVDRAYLLIVNTPDECVVGGERRAVAAVAERLGASPVMVEGVTTVHCEVARQVGQAYRDLHLLDATPPADLRIYSHALGEARRVTSEGAADSMHAQSVDTIDYPRVVERAYDDGARIFVETGPRGSCSRMVSKILAGRPHVVRSAWQPGVDPVTSVLRLLGRLAAERVPLSLDALYAVETSVVGHGVASGNAGSPVFSRRVGRVVTAQATPTAPSPAPSLPPSSPSPLPPAPQQPKVVASSVMNTKTEEKSAKPSASLPPPKRPATSVAVPVGVAGREEKQAKPVASLPAASLSSLPSLSDTVIPMVHTLMASETAAAKAHAAYLQLNVSATQVQRAAVEMQMRLLAGMPDEVRSYLAQGLRAAGAGAPLPPLPALDAPPVTVQATAVPAIAAPAAPAAAAPVRLPHPDAVWDREDCVKIAVGKIAEVFGPDFAEVDTYPTRVRLPDGPMNFVHRIMHISGDRGSKDRVKLGSGRIVTEHDVTAGEWYLDNGRIPTGVAVEAGQADLCLSGWLGIDFKTKGVAMYRLLDATVTIHDHLPRAGDIIRYDIRALRFIRQADTYLYFFEYDGTVDGRPFITMRDGCAGFFTPRQLDEGRGLVLTDEDLARHPGKLPPDWRPLVPFEAVESYDDAQLEALRNGDLASCFGEAFAGLPVRQPLTFPGGKLHLVDRVTEMDPTGGRFGLGSIRAEIDIAPDAWFLVCHFSDDNVMPGTLMYESCMQAWKVFLLRQGWVAEAADAVFEPVVDVRSRLRCRGQVVPGDLQAQYYIEIKELGYGPEPYSIADAIMYVDGRAIVQCLDMSLRLSGVSRSDMERVWAGRGGAAAAPLARPAPVSSPDSLVRRAVVALPEVSAPVLPTEGREARPFVVPPADGVIPSGKPFRGSPAIPEQGAAPAVYGPSQILAYARGYPSEGFGERYRVFDGDRYLARLPNPPYLLLDRITYVEGEPFVMDGTGTVIGQYDVPPDAWYFDANRQEYMPFSVILEIPLQVCGWYAAFCGSGLTGGPDAGLRFRNLDGSAVLHEPLGRDTGTLTSKIRFLSASSSGGMIIQKFDYQVFRQGRVVYEGDTVFGFFSAAALAQQVGIRGAKVYEPAADEVRRSRPFPLPSVPPLTPADDTKPTERGLVQPGKAYRMNDEVALLIPDGGPAGLGFIRGTKKVTRADWFFDAHFYGDPVIPGSLGLEAFLQLVKAAAINRWGAALSQTHHFEPMASGQRHSWTYRGQVVPTNREVVVDAWVTAWDDATHTVTASGFLKADGKPIYQMTDFALRAVPRG